MPVCTTRDGVEIFYGLAMVPGDKERFTKDLLDFLRS